jgi:hypothetical protein
MFGVGESFFLYEDAPAGEGLTTIMMVLLVHGEVKMLLVASLRV